MDFHSTNFLRRGDMSIEILNQIQWYADIEDEAVLSSRGVRFGFLGKGQESFSCHHAKQVHGNSVVKADSRTEAKTAERVHADAIFTQDPTLVVGVQTADCLPILLCNEARSTVMAVHGGWKGLKAGIIDSAILNMRKREPNEAIYASIGPAIAHCHYEVGPELVEMVQGLLKSDQVPFCLSKGVRDRWFLDLPTLGIFALINSGVLPQHISVCRSCTHCLQEKWHSFRRDASHSVRNWSWIQLPSV